LTKGGTEKEGEVSFEGGRRESGTKRRTELGDLPVVRAGGIFELLIVILLLSEHLFVLERLEEPVGLKDPAALRERSDELRSSARSSRFRLLAGGTQFVALREVAHLVVGIILSLVLLVGSLDVLEQARRSRGLFASPVERAKEEAPVFGFTDGGGRAHQI